MEAERLTQTRHCSPGPGHQSQNGGVAASPLSLPALSAPGPPLQQTLQGPLKERQKHCKPKV